MKERIHTKKEELDYLTEKYKTHPHLFAQTLFVDDAPTLGEFGIHVPNKESFVSGALKLWPEDFIVEEITKAGETLTVSAGDSSADVGPQTSILTATLVKCGVSTLEAIDDIARELSISKDDIGYAGMKDKEAITAQRISLKGVTYEQATQVTSPFFFLKDFSYAKNSILKGALQGNRFSILVRTPVSLLDEEHGKQVARALETVNEKGFYNFFYLQRFSIPRLRNYQWAYDILKGNYKDAVHDVITFGTEREVPFFRQVRSELAKAFGNWKAMEEIAAPFSLTFANELKMIRHLSEHPDDFAGSLATIPDQVTIWLNALGSLFFNKKISDCVMRGQEPPSELPFFLSTKMPEQLVYKDMLARYGLWPVPFENLKPFPFVNLKGGHRVPTKSRAKILKGDVVKEGLMLEFELNKGQYATTFLSHMFNLISGPPPKTLRIERIDTKALLGEQSLSDVLKRFESVIQQPDDEGLNQLLARTD